MPHFDAHARRTLRIHRDASNSGTETETDGAETSHDHRRQYELDRIAGVANPKTVTLPVAKIVPLLIHAAENNRTWLQDFAGDTVRIDADLYEVLLAYQQFIDRKVA